MFQVGYRWGWGWRFVTKSQTSLQTCLLIVSGEGTEGYGILSGRILLCHAVHFPLVLQPTNPLHPLSPC